MDILKVRDSRTGKWISIPAFKGVDGKTPIKGVDYFTEEELQEITANSLHTTRIPTFEEIDNTPFKTMIKACADTWFAAAADSKVSYGSLSVDDTDNMATRVNPMLYATRNSDQAFTTTYRDIWSEVKAGGAMSVNCITLANMLIMGIPFEQSRLNGHENIVGGMGYAFDICKYIEPTKEDNTVFYNPNKKLDITTFERILTQASFTETCSALGLVKSMKSSETANDGEIWYDAIKPGDVLFNSSHTMFCLDVEATDNEIKIHYIDAGSANTPAINYHTITVTDGISSASKPLVRVIRPYYTYANSNLPNLMKYNNKKFMGLDGPYPGIAKNENLNTYLIPGEYRCASDNNAKSLANKPASLAKAFKLVVENLLDDSTASTGIKYRYLKQIITTVQGTVYYRILKCDQPIETIISLSEWHEMAVTDQSSEVVNIEFNSEYATATDAGQPNQYVVKDGVAYVTLDFVANADLNGQIITSTTFPNPPINFTVSCVPFNQENYTRTGVIIITGDSLGLSGIGLMTGCRYLVSFSYPVA